MMPFSSEPWDGGAVESSLDATDYCRVCLFDLNEAGATKVKAKCKAPVRARPGGPINLNALAAVAGALVGGRGGIDVPPEEKRKGARRLVGWYREAGKTPPPLLVRLAGLRS